MLVSLHVKNLALIQETEVFFGPRLNILSGETGAGKSIIIGSVGLALGGRADRELIRTGADYALIELVFSLDKPGQLERVKQLDIPMEEDGLVILQRRIMPGRSLSRVNGETVNARLLKQLSGILIDIHGQHDSQQLLETKKHLEILDDFAGEELSNIKEAIKADYDSYKKIKKELSALDMDERERERLLSLAQIASGGELSRIMLALKTVTAGGEDKDTFIFDEIDTGISGKTAWKVSQKLSLLSRARQVICITHLPQIAAMADNHFMIEKKSGGSSTQTSIYELSEDEILQELARMLGGDMITDSTLANARELKDMAANTKQY